ncbi:hypothetical protein SAMN06295974_3640 [Plantibacter flavus]|uniref:Asp23/Gls24 family envelope stress response protein n=1 Tax=Plantibacter flavus TaxID=150123 RepID=A0A3N2C631_9MICO|nr:hypothetical protein [Plantibacter flavus]ROR82956.1 hypothetical protein EDD42_3058 [Plantibacter flavus]SMG47584.1 hypothetical protein SAMN06295974_3640 [Plantibacter flavus]
MSDLTETDDDLVALASSLDDVVQAVPGVVGLTAVEPALLRAAREGVGAVLGSADQQARVRVKRVRDVFTVHANISVAAEAASPAVAQAVHRAIAERITSSVGGATPSITVRVIDVVPSGSQD